MESSKRELFGQMGTLMLPLILITITEIIFSLMNFGTLIIFSVINGFILSVMMMYTVFFIVLSITKKSSLANITITIYLLMITLINQLKMTYMGEPLAFSDVKYLEFINQVLDMLGNNINSLVKSHLIYIILGIICIGGIILFSIKTNVTLENKKTRILTGGISLIFLVILFLPNVITKQICLKLFFNEGARKDYATYVNLTEYYEKHGLIAGMYGIYLEDHIFEPKGYNEKSLTQVLEITEDNIANKEKIIGKPNIIVVLSESFFDISKIGNIEFDKEITSNFNSLKEKGVLFEMISPSYGGLTANVEMEFLTGFNLAYYNKGFTPYLQLYNNKKEKMSIVEELNNNGYITKIITCTNELFYNRENVYKNMGIDERIFLNKVDKVNYKGGLLSDEYVTAEIIRQLKYKDSRYRMFCMALTVQQHMPYTIEKYDSYDINILNSTLSKEKEDIVLAYAQGAYDADKQLGILYDYIQTIKEPTILIFFGDHLPYLRTQTGDNVLDELEYFNSQNEMLDNYRMYNTQALLVSNYDIKEQGEKYCSPDLIMPYVLSKMDINLNEYYNFLATSADNLPSYNYLISSDKNGNLYNTNELSGQMKEQYLLREQLQYMYFIK